MAKKEIAIGLLIASVILLSVYGADAMVASSSQSIPKRGFLPLDEATRGGALGGGAVAMSIIAFAIAYRIPSSAISILLYINGGLIIAGMVALIGQGALSGPNSSSAYSTVGSTLALGAILVGLGIWKAVINKRKIEQSTQTQKK
jgi:hypothetical protein